MPARVDASAASCGCCGYTHNGGRSPYGPNGTCVRCGAPAPNTPLAFEEYIASYWRCAGCGRHFYRPSGRNIRECMECGATHYIRRMSLIRRDARAGCWVPVPPTSEQILCQGVDWGCGGCGECCGGDSGECSGCNYCEGSHSADPYHGLFFRRNPVFHTADKYKEHKTNPLARHASVEIEVAFIDPVKCDQLIKVVKQWGGSIVHDGSINPDGAAGGFEINTAPASGDKFVKQLQDIEEALVYGKARLNRNCGLHVHVDARDLSWDEVANVAETYTRCEDFLFGLVAPSRVTNKFCRPVASKLATALNQYRRTIQGQYAEQPGEPNTWKKRFLEAMYGSLGSARDLRREKYVDARYWAFNIHTWMYRKTLEFRHHHGTLQASKIINWAMLCTNLVDKGAGLWRPTANENGALAKELAVSTGHLNWIAGRWNRFHPEGQLTRALLPSDSMEI